MADIIPFDSRRRRSGRTSRWTRAESYAPGPKPAKRSWGASFVAALVVLPALAFTTVLLWDRPLALRPGASEDAAADRESARFAVCGSGARVDCVVDGDTFWYRGDKIRVADINTPEVSEPGCAHEAALGTRATARLHSLLNAGPFTLEPVDRDRDAYGRLLRVVTRAGQSLGDTLVNEGLAEPWRGYRRSWCQG